MGKVRNGHIKRITDQDIQSSVLEVMGTNVSTNYITCPADPNKTLGIKLPFLVMILKNLKKYFTFEVPGLQLPVDDAGEAIHLHHADASRRGLESDSVQLVRLHAPCVRHELHRDAARSDPRELPVAPHLLLRPPLLGGGVAARIQALLAGAEGPGSPEGVTLREVCPPSLLVGMRRDPQWLPGGPFIGLTTSELQSQLRSQLRGLLRRVFCAEKQCLRARRVASCTFAPASSLHSWLCGWFLAVRCS